MSLRAVIACLVWALSLAAVHAQDAQPLLSEVVLASATDQAPTSAPAFEPPPANQMPATQLLTPAAGAVTPPDQVIVDPAAPQPTDWPRAQATATDTGIHRIWKFVPHGMVPYIGPRTPDSQKDIGYGQPFEGIGWRSNPFSISVFSGVTDGGALMPGRVNQLPSYYGGLNIGWDYDHYWGIEKRLGFGAMRLEDGNHQTISATGLAVTGEYRLMYYPLGDARWRPFLTAGVGWSDFYFTDDRGVSHLDTVGMVPFGIGLKYMYTDRIVFRGDVIDELTFGNNLSGNFQYVAITGGLEFRYGKRLIHMPWHRKDS